MYGILKNGVLSYAPKNYKIKDGYILNFNNDISLIKKYGFKEVINIPPVINQETHYYSLKGYEETEECINVLYEVKEIVKETTLDEDIKRIDKELQVTQSAVDFILFNGGVGLNEYKIKMPYNGIENNKKGGGSMGAYLAMRIIKGVITYDEVIRSYGQFKADIDSILKLEGHGDLITK